METGLEKIGFWYEKMPEHLRKKYFSHLKNGEVTSVSLTGSDEIDFIEYVRTRTPKSEKIYTQDFMRYFANYAIFCNGGKKYVKIVDETLKEELFNTDIDKMTLNDLNLPFDTFYVELGHEYSFDTGNSKIRVKIEGAFIQSFNDWIEVISLETYNGLPTPVLTYCSIFKDIPIKDQIIKIADGIFESSYSQVFSKSSKTAIDKFEIGLISNIVKLFSVLFYLDYAQRELKLSIVEKNEWKPFANAIARGKVTQFNAKRITAYHYINLSSNRKSTDNRDLSPSKSGHKQTKMTLVRGHWKRQPYGSRHQDQVFKTIWIKPYWKNLYYEASEEMHVYKIQ